LKVRRRQRWWEIFGHCAPSHQGWSPSRRAVLALLAGAFSFSLMTVCVKQLHGRLPVAEVVLGRALVSVVLSGWLVRRAGLDPLGQRRGLLALRGAVGTAALFCVYLGVMRLPLAAATVLQYLYPSLTALLAWAWLGERPGARIALAMTLGWLGVLVMAHPFGGGGPGQTLPPDGVAWAVAGALLTAVAYVSVRELGRSEHPQVIVLWFPLISLPLSLPLVALEPTLPTLPELGWLLGVGLFTQLGQIGLTHGLMHLSAARATTISYAQVAFAALWGWLVFGEGIGAPTLAGGGLILASILVGQGGERRVQ
jgi:drug/metabolite transporter (DMT)-like permease